MSLQRINCVEWSLLVILLFLLVGIDRSWGIQRSLLVLLDSWENFLSVLHKLSSRLRASWSLTLARNRGSSHHSSGREDSAMEDRREEHSSTSLGQVISWVHDLCGVPPAPAKPRKMSGFSAAQDVFTQSFYSYYLPMGDASLDILMDINDCISLQSSGMQLEKVFKLLPYPGVGGRHYYPIEGEEVV